jgi:hypothetical protein
MSQKLEIGNPDHIQQVIQYELNHGYDRYADQKIKLDKD